MNITHDEFAAVYRSYAKKLVGRIGRKVRNYEDAQDLADQVWLKLWRACVECQVKSKKALASMVYTSANRIMIDYFRRKERERGYIQFEKERMACEKQLR